MPVMHYYLDKIKLVAINVDAIVANNLEVKVDLPHYVDVTLVEEIGKVIEAFKDSFMAKPIETIPNSIVEEETMVHDSLVINIASLAVVD